MAALKGGEVERYLAKPNFSNTIHLVYGPDRGLVSERVKKLAQATGVDLDDPFSAIKLEAGDLNAEPDRLMNEAYTVSMFGGDRLIWLRGAGNDASLVKQLEQILKSPPENTYCLIEAGDLKKGTKLRDVIERSQNALAIPCYSDGVRDIGEIIDDALSANNLKLSFDARQFLLTQLGGDRMASRAEIDKLCLYVQGADEITVDDIQAIIGDASLVSFDAITDAIITGNVSGFDQAVTKFASSGGSIHQLFATVLRQFQSLDKMRAQMEEGGKTANAVINAARPPIFFARKKAVEAALNKWSSQGLRAAHDRLQTTLLECRKNNNIDNEIAYMALLGLTIQAARRR